MWLVKNISLEYELKEECELEKNTRSKKTKLQSLGCCFGVPTKHSHTVSVGVHETHH